MKKTLGTAVAVIMGATLAGISTPANAATIAYSGTGWQILTEKNIGGVAPSQQFTVTFASQTTKDLTAKWLTRALPQINEAGLKLKIGGVESGDINACPPKGHVWIIRKYRPAGKAGVSKTLPCHNSDNTARGGVVMMDSEYYDGSWYLPTYMKWNVHPHEVLHALGLDHPNTDLDEDGTVESGECVATSYGNKPIMCSPNGGYSTSTNQGKLVGYDVNGVKALLDNARAAGIQ